jgi:hypothetical protein
MCLVEGDLCRPGRRSPFTRLLVCKILRKAVHDFRVIR